MSGQDILVVARPVLEALSFVGTAALAVIAGIGLKQLSLLKRDTRLRSERAAKEKAIQAADAYLNEYTALDGVFYKDYKGKGLPEYEGPIGNFSPDSMPPAVRKAALQRYECTTWLPAHNRLESIAASFVTGVADEAVGFTIIGRSYCSTVRASYDVIALSRRDPTHPYWPSTVALYHIWSPRLEKQALLKARDAITERAGKIPETRIPPIGE